MTCVPAMWAPRFYTHGGHGILWAKACGHADGNKGCAKPCRRRATHTPSICSWSCSGIFVHSDPTLADKSKGSTMGVNMLLLFF